MCQIGSGLSTQLVAHVSWRQAWAVQRSPRINDKGWPQAVTGLRPTLFCLEYPLRGCFYLPLSARRRLPFFCFAKKKGSKEKATRRRRNSRKNGHQPGAAHTLRSKEGGLLPGWRPFLRPAPTGAGRAGSVPADGSVEVNRVLRSPDKPQVHPGNTKVGRKPSQACGQPFLGR